MICKGLIFATGLAIGVSGAQAATYTFEFDNATAGWGNSVTVGANEDSAVKIKATSATYTPDATDASAPEDFSFTYNDSKVATWNGAGLGVCGDWSSGRHGSGCDDDSHTVDGTGRNDLAIFSFADDAAYVLNSITFGYFNDFVKAGEVEWKQVCTGHGRHKSCKWVEIKTSPDIVFEDIFDFFLGEDLAFQNRSPVGDGTFTFTGDPVIASTFGIGASGKYDSFKIVSISVSEPELPPVPLPAAGLLMVGGLAALGAVRRRSRAA